MVYCGFLENSTDVSIKEIHVFTYLPLLESNILDVLGISYY